MGTITSAGTGAWSAGATWVGGVAPNLAVDDAVVTGGHVVTIAPATNLTLAAGRTIIINTAGGESVLACQGTMALGGEVTCAGRFRLEGGTITQNVHFVVQAGGKLDVYSGAWTVAGSNKILKIYGTATLYGGTVALAPVGGIVGLYTGTLILRGGSLVMNTGGGAALSLNIGPSQIICRRREWMRIYWSDGTPLFPFEAVYGFRTRGQAGP